MCLNLYIKSEENAPQLTASYQSWPFWGWQALVVFCLSRPMFYCKVLVPFGLGLVYVVAILADIGVLVNGHFGAFLGGPLEALI